MAKGTQKINLYSPKQHIKRKRVHSKKRSTPNKGADLYKKPYKGQGK